MRAARAVVDERAHGDEPVYGINTGFGSFAEVKIAPDALETLQVNLLRSHAAGSRDPENRRVVRAIAGARQAGRDRALQNRQSALAAFHRDGEAHPRSKPRRPTVYHDHPLGCEQRTVHERAVARLLDVAGEQALNARDRAFTGSKQVDNPDIGRCNNGAGAQLIDDLGGHRVTLQPRDGRARRRGKNVAHKSASSPAECPASDSHTNVAPLPSSVPAA